MRRGFTLIELLAAMAILAVVSIMGVQALGGVFQQRAVLNRVDDRSAALIRTLSALRQDLEAALPPPMTGDTVTAGIAVEPGRLRWLRGGLADLPGDPSTGAGSVLWSVAEGRLSRQLSRMPQGSGGPARVILEGVTALALVPLGLPEGDEADPRLLAPGYEVTLETALWGRLRLVVAR
ncbi:prepilin-type N-terminal cleavage/methylation domain-containing protein [Pararhodobacter sp.]|uniref:PulJ/GspJ family protein n=1 Tax=Pararhodobacter sp. TaxID=2127056 RepID=UPI002AFFE236|nr:prepilin-type N-terminal cleavage/methylation domain-containing protein [Pararhodobacter sp.]